MLTLPAPSASRNSLGAEPELGPQPPAAKPGVHCQRHPCPEPAMHSLALWSLRCAAQLSLTSSPTGQVGHWGVPHARRGPKGNKAKGKCLLAPSLPHAGATGSFRAAVAMQPCLFRESLAEAGSTLKAGPGACSAVWGRPGLGPPRPCPSGPMGCILCRGTPAPCFLQ